MKKRILKVIIPILIFGIFVVGYITKEITFAKPVYNEFIIGIIDSEISENMLRKYFL